MSNPGSSPDLDSLRRNFFSGATRTYTWRKQQLQKLQKAIREHEKEIAAALRQDLKKSPEEAYATETGLVLAEIRVLLKNLHKWMRPRQVGTDLVNMPSASTIYRDPLGVVLIIAPWNYPFQLSLIPLAAAIAGGNCVVLKPSELAPSTAAIVEKIATSVFPPELVRVIQGDGAERIPALMQSFRFDHIFFTGSIPVGRAIYQQAAKDLIPVTLELGGKSPAIVERDAHIRTTARRIVIAKFTNAGQTCIAPDYLLVHEDIKEKLVKALRETILEFYGERPQESDDYGKIINERRFDTLTSYLSQGKILAGGQYDRAHLFIEPAILEGVSLDQPLMNEEIFGPLLPVMTYRTMEEALAIVRRNPDPLAFYLFTNDKEKEERWLGNLTAGGGCINNAAWHFTNHHLPFGGVGNSGIGAYHGKYSFEAFTRAKGVMKTPTWWDPRVKYPPFKGKLKWFKLFIR